MWQLGVNEIVLLGVIYFTLYIITLCRIKGFMLYPALGFLIIGAVHGLYVSNIGSLILGIIGLVGFIFCPYKDEGRGKWYCSCFE